MMGAALTIRQARVTDAARLAELNGELGYPSRPEQVLARLQALLARADQQVFVGDLAGVGVAGWVHVYRQELLESDLTAEIGGLVVAQSCRRMGIGQQLMAAAEAWARENGCGAVHLRSNVIRTGAHAFYKSLGYQINKTSYSFLKDL
jgi:GNAT superfamily N-acetyltransferase